MIRLGTYLEATREQLGRRMRERPLSELERAAGARETLPFCEALSRPGTSLIAEHKRRSPSAGAIRDDLSVADVVAAYGRGGAAALSVLTDERHFGGSLADLEQARAASDLPILRKDFTIDRYQLYEARAAGADAVLLIVGSGPPEVLAELQAEADALDLDVLVEVHSGEDLDTALALDADVIGINNRNLEDLSVSLDVTFELIPEVPAGKTVVAESGIATRSDVEALEGVGVDAILVGEALMRAADPEAATRELVRPDEATGEADAIG